METHEKVCRNNAKMSLWKDETGHIQEVNFSNNKLPETRISNNYVCKECGKDYKMKRSLIFHTKSKCGTLNPHKCNVCNKELKTAASLHTHMIRHEGSRNFMCRFCAKLFVTMGQLEIHERVHTQDKPFVCEVCGKCFRHRQSLVTHSTLHTGIKPFNCGNCKRSFSCVGNLLKHRHTHVECARLPLTTHTIANPLTKLKLQANTPKNCKLKHFLKEKVQGSKKENSRKPKVKGPKSIDSRKRNLSDVTSNYSDYKEQKSPVECFRGNSKSSLEQLNNSNDKVGCEISSTLIKCPQNFAETSPKKYFAATVNNQETGCNSVDSIKILKEPATKILDSPHGNENKNDITYNEDNVKELNNSLTLTNTENGGSIMHNVSEEVIDADSTILMKAKNSENKLKSNNINCRTCNRCKTNFLNKEELEQHQRKEHPEMLTCSICDKIYSTEYSLKVHHKTFHIGIPRKVYRYICPQCGKQFNQKASLMAHEKNKCDTSLTFLCELCNKSFATAHSQKTHMRVHSTKKFLCNYCGKRFHWKTQLKIHERSHTGDKPFSCLYCPKVFAYRESLITHSSIHTGIKPHLCEACGSRFSCIGNLIKHRITHVSTCGPYKTRSKTETNI